MTMSRTLLCDWIVGDATDPGLHGQIHALEQLAAVEIIRRQH
jgi:hypothetical protein